MCALLKVVLKHVRHILDWSHFFQSVTAVGAKNELSACYRVLSISTSLFWVSHYIPASDECCVLTFNAAIKLSYIHQASMIHPVIYFPLILFTQGCLFFNGLQAPPPSLVIEVFSPSVVQWCVHSWDNFEVQSLLFLESSVTALCRCLDHSQVSLTSKSPL